MNHTNAPRILKEAYKICPQMWLFGATLLGAIREKKIISWDKDIDVGLLSEHMTDEIVEKFRKAGFLVTLVYKFSHPKMSEYFPDFLGKYGKVVVKKGGVKIEICCFAKGLDGRFYYASGTPRLFGLDYDVVLPLKEIPFYNFNALVPENSEAQLAFVYGDDWRTPREKWYFTPEHYKRREFTIVELAGDDGTKWSKTTGARVIKESENI